jgi:hypothetical protein
VVSPISIVQTTAFVQLMIIYLLPTVSIQKKGRIRLLQTPDRPEKYVGFAIESLWTRCLKIVVSTSRQALYLFPGS